MLGIFFRISKERAFGIVDLKMTAIIITIQKVLSAVIGSLTPRPHVFLNFFFPIDTASGLKHPTNSAANPDILNPLSRVKKKK